jgi:hypothetical protein
MPSINGNTVTVGGLAHIHSISNIENFDIASPPVQVCFCRGGKPDCSYNPGPVPIRRDQLAEIPLSLAALDQINRPIEAIIYNRLSSGDDLCQHHIQINNGNCSVINFTASLNLNESQREELILLTNGSCKKTPNSQVRLTLTVYCLKCPIGFELVEDEEGCRCQCDKNLFPFISNCRPSSKTLVRDKNVWIAYLNSTDDSEDYQYLKHPYCPFDYCYPSSSLPYIFKHRYWTGLLLLSRVLLHLVSAVNTTGDPRLTIVALSLIIACLLLIKGVIASKVYRNKLVDISETIVHFNLLALSALTWHKSRC